MNASEPVRSKSAGFHLMLMCLLMVHVSKSNPRIDGFSNSTNLVEYQYRYSVDESKSKGPVMDRWEHRIGEYVKGAYSVLEPDGRIRTVDYEVDGVKGYHAVIRMNEPGPGLLSYQQLRKSQELFPVAALPTAVFKSSLPTRNARNDGKIWNYHSRSPYINDLKSDHKADATYQVSRISATNATQNLPRSPANYNVPQTRNLIHFLKPTAFIVEKTAGGAERDVRDAKRILEKEKKIISNLPISAGKNTEQRRIRNSKLVKRFKSMEEFIN